MNDDEGRAQSRMETTMTEPIAPWPDFAGQQIRRGDLLIHPSGQQGTVLYWPDESPEEDRWRVAYADGTISRLGLQIGEKSMGVVAAQPDDVLDALDLPPLSYRTDGGSINRGKLRATIANPREYLPETHWMCTAEPWGSLKYMLDGYPGSVRSCYKYGPENLVASMSITFLGMKDERARLLESCIDLVKALRALTSEQQRGFFNIGLSTAESLIATLQRPRSPS